MSSKNAAWLPPFLSGCMARSSSRHLTSSNIGRVDVRSKSLAGYSFVFIRFLFVLIRLVGML